MLCCMQASAPSVLNRLKDIRVGIGETAVLTCRVCGKPRPNIMWTGPDRTQISNSSQTLCDYYDDGLARLQVSVPSCSTLCFVMWLPCYYVILPHVLRYKQLSLPG